ncbi:hypothetical protein [Paraburkholderia sp. BCC1885]|nr:hypothetical protein [Paraburkholderia sp. BCC1885]
MAANSFWLMEPPIYTSYIAFAGARAIASDLFLSPFLSPFLSANKRGGDS